jgi:phage protein D
MPERAPNQLAVYNATPTVRVDAREHEKINELLIGMEMIEQQGGMSALELRFSNIASDPRGGAGYAFEDERILKLNAKVALYAGDRNAPREIFQGRITGLEAHFPGAAPAELVVLAEDVFQQARMARRTKVHENVSIADLARDLASQFGLQPVVTGFAQQLPPQMQLNESDLAFLRRLLARYDGDMQVVGGEMHVSPRADVRRGAIELSLNGQLKRARVMADLAHQVTEITVSGWDAAEGQRVSAASQGANFQPGSGRSGAEMLRAGVGERSEHVGHLAATTAIEAQAMADAAFDSRARRFVCVECTAQGDPALRVGTHVTLGGLGRRFDNTYYVTRACHRFDVARGYETDFEAESAYWGQA